MGNIKRLPLGWCPNCRSNGPPRDMRCPDCGCLHERENRLVPVSQLRGAVEERDRYREQAQRFRTIMASASELQPADCRRLIRDALRGQ
jgi:hypothetical protein